MTCDFRTYLADRWPTPVPLKKVMTMGGAKEHRVIADAFARVPDGYVAMKQETPTLARFFILDNEEQQDLWNAGNLPMYGWDEEPHMMYREEET